MTPSFDPFMPNPITRTPETLTPDEADKLMTSGDGCCMFCEVDLNLGRGHGDWCKWPVIRAAWEMDLLCHKSFVEHHKSVDEQCLDLIKRLEAAENAMRDVLADHDERMALYRDMESQPHRMRAMRRLRAFLAGEEKP